MAEMEAVTRRWEADAQSGGSWLSQNVRPMSSSILYVNSLLQQVSFLKYELNNVVNQLLMLTYGRCLFWWQKSFEKTRK